MLFYTNERVIIYRLLCIMMMESAIDCGGMYIRRTMKLHFNELREVGVGLDLRGIYESLHSHCTCGDKYF